MNDAKVRCRRAVRLYRWKLVAKNNQPWELYNVEKDRSELKMSLPLILKKSPSCPCCKNWAKRCDVVSPDSLPSVCATNPAGE